MALDDPKFRPAVRFTMKTVVVALWMPVLVALVVGFAASFMGHVSAARQLADCHARIERLQQLAANARIAFDLDRRDVLDEILRAMDERPEPRAR